MFEDNFLDMKTSSGNRLSTKTAMEVATNLTTGLFQPVYEQIDPVRLGEIARTMRIAQEYGQRLDAVSDNLKNMALQRLVSGYPSHGFVIDRDETERLFVNVRQPTDNERTLAHCLESFVEGVTRDPNAHADPGSPYPKPIVQFVSTPLEGERKDQDEGQSDGEDTAGEREEAEPTPRDTGASLISELAQNGQGSEERSPQSQSSRGL